MMKTSPMIPAGSKICPPTPWPYLRIPWAVVIVAVSLLLQGSLLLTARLGLGKNESVLISLILGLILPMAIAVGWVSPNPRATLRLKGISLRSACLVAGASLCFTLLAASTIEMLLRMGGLPPGIETLLEKEEQLLREIFSLRGGRDQLTVALVVMVVAPIAEELLFRGLLQGSLERRLGNWPGLVVTALAFGLLHGRLRFVPVSLLGILMGYAVMRTNSVLSGIVAHSTNNALAMSLAFWIKAELISFDSLAWSMSLGGLGLVIFLWFLRRSTSTMNRIPKMIPLPNHRTGSICQGTQGIAPGQEHDWGEDL